jgi:hypothetical protein
MVEDAKRRAKENAASEAVVKQTTKKLSRVRVVD